MTHAPHGALFRGDCLFLSFNAGFFVMFALAQFGEDAGLFTQFFKTTNGAFDGLVFSNSNSGHKMKSPPIPAALLSSVNSS